MLARWCALQNQGTQPGFFWCNFRIIITTGLYKVGNLAWAHISRMATWKKASPQKYKGPFCRGVMWKNLGPPWKPWNVQNPFCRGKLLFHMSGRSGRWASKSETSVPPFFSTKWETCKINVICIFECWQTSKPLQNEEPTVSAIYKMFPLQNQEPVIAYPCRHIGCPKKWFWRTPRGPDNGEESFAGMLLEGPRIWYHFAVTVLSFAPREIVYFSQLRRLVLQSRQPEAQEKGNESQGSIWAWKHDGIFICWIPALGNHHATIYLSCPKTSHSSHELNSTFQPSAAPTLPTR